MAEAVPGYVRPLVVGCDKLYPEHIEVRLQTSLDTVDDRTKMPPICCYGYKLGFSSHHNAGMVS